MSITGMTTKYCIVFQSTECPELCHECRFCVMGGRQRVPFLQRSSFPQIRLFSRQKALQRVGQDSLAPTEEVSVLNRPNSVRQSFLLHEIKDPRAFLTLTGVISGRQRLQTQTHTEGTFRPPSARDPHSCRGILTTANGLFGRWWVLQ